MTPINTTANTVPRGLVLLTPGNVYDVLLDWNVRAGDWRATVTRRSDGATLGAHMRLSSNLPLFRADGGALYVFGQSDHHITDLDTGRIRLYWVLDSELLVNSTTADTPGVLV